MLFPKYLDKALNKNFLSEFDSHFDAMDNNSEDLFSSQNTSQGTNINEQIDITLQVIVLAFVLLNLQKCLFIIVSPLLKGPAISGNSVSLCLAEPTKVLVYYSVTPIERASHF